jgi:hypothetical protein
MENAPKSRANAEKPDSALLIARVGSGNGTLYLASAIGHSKELIRKKQMLDEWRRVGEAHANLGAWRYSAGNCNSKLATYLHRHAFHKCLS